MNHAEEIWKTLVRATVDKKHPWRVVGFSTSGPKGPQVRSVILRAVNTGEHHLVFYTDRRSQKMTDIAHDPRVALLFWNPRSNTQLRVCGIAAPQTSELIVNSLWARIPDYARKDYATLSAPGDALPGGDLVYDFDTARANFVVLNVKVLSLELLELKREGHVRFRCELDETGHWIHQNMIP
ncbi:MULTISPECIES: pyridoxamine 5'-phosphate oxidase family protein [unclassified Limnobacter]|jgi:pyridoxamine 5'-phosphate oxidase|uniref:pyridoxamine 5'-phosphate oxidase family protein n=1 Tax=unclassified Limnobacter TaxID=2630203 RepID=UPI0025BDFB0E|nr:MULTISPECIES: pyridoxamine 5'-phosphate oxidase family protein [unclassified Limnobacter]|tara:strand:+ start:149 stop:694 length:546 start_codon:yes stop_codon:yes gene_type:complete